MIPLTTKLPIVNDSQYYAMASSSNYQNLNTSFLANTLAGSFSSGIANDNSFRRYRSCLTYGVFEQGSFGQHRRSIFYEVGRKCSTISEMLASSTGKVGISLLDASVPTNAVEAANFESWARRHSNFSPTWTHMDLCGVIERLAKAVATQSIFGDVSTSHMRGGQPVRITALGSLDTPVTASSSSVFIPRTVDSIESQDVFSVLAAAVNGEGAAVVTDVLRLDTNDNQPLVPTVEGHTLARACVEALRILGANYEANGAGDLYAYALTRGIHAAVTVVGHTDEGGWFRNVLRGSAFRVPYGGINQQLRDYPYLPPLSGQSMASVASWVDSVALKTAALVAHCDPCTTLESGVFPTVFVSGEAPPVKKNLGKGSTQEARTIGRQLASDLGRFIPWYIKGLCKLFGLTSNSGVAEVHMAAVGRLALGNATERHLQFETVAPYFWIEPTSLIPANFLSSPAEEAGFASLTSPGEVSSMRTFETVKEIGRGGNANHVSLAFRMRTARTSGLVCAFAADPAVLTSMRLYQYDTSSVLLEGAGPDDSEYLRAKHDRAAPLSDYLWTRGQSAIPAPAELINIQGVYGAKYKAVSWDDDFNATATGLPEIWELTDHSVTLRATVPTAIPNGPSNAAQRDARHARNRAAITLVQATIRNRNVGETASPVMEISDVPPLLEGASLFPQHTELSTQHEPSNMAKPILGEPGADRNDDAGHEMGTPRVPVMMHGSVTGPTPLRQPHAPRPIAPTPALPVTAPDASTATPLPPSNE